MPGVSQQQLVHLGSGGRAAVSLPPHKVDFGEFVNRYLHSFSFLSFTIRNIIYNHA